MKPDFSNLQLNNVIVHEVPKSFANREDNEPIRFSDIESSPTPDVLQRICDKFVGDLTKKGRAIVSLQDPKSRIPEIVGRYFQGSETAFIPMSQEIAQTLRDTQKGTNSGGLLLVSHATLGDEEGLLIAKIESETAMQAKFAQVNGKSTVTVSYLEDLLFHSQSKVYKIGLFLSSQSDIGGFAADQQSGGGNLAKFFLEDFLGCEYRGQPDELSKKFFEESIAWVNKTEISPSTKSKYMIALYSEMNSNFKDLAVDRFAATHIETGQQKDDYARHMKTNGVPDTPFEKNIRLIEKKISQMAYYFESNVLVVTPTSAIDDGTVQITGGDNEKLTLTVKDDLKDVKSRG
ncbi:nucleoid-associated protein [Streptomonospora sp. PA3]|uniref:nucleoid-associated protein n=1 Tax=Streptomonospora sp. PA3 TaxID=2607326 RepID=UPI0012DFE1BE|nr:nucleoid-associated protein [Streptomonospora sp. PA3]MUL43094.1 nucleoid-associated protein [Streptomonospora sp. PA3]